MIVTIRNFDSRSHRFGKPKHICEATMPPLITEDKDGNVVITIDGTGASRVDLTMDHDTMRAMIARYRTLFG